MIDLFVWGMKKLPGDSTVCPGALFGINKWKVECASTLLRISLGWARTDTSLGTWDILPGDLGAGAGSHIFFVGPHCSSVSPYRNLMSFITR